MYRTECENDLAREIATPLKTANFEFIYYPETNSHVRSWNCELGTGGVGTIKYPGKLHAPCAHSLIVFNFGVSARVAPTLGTGN